MTSACRNSQGLPRVEDRRVEGVGSWRQRQSQQQNYAEEKVFDSYPHVAGEVLETNALLESHHKILAVW